MTEPYVTNNTRRNAVPINSAQSVSNGATQDSATKNVAPIDTVSVSPTHSRADDAWETSDQGPVESCVGQASAHPDDHYHPERSIGWVALVAIAVGLCLGVYVIWRL